MKQVLIIFVREPELGKVKTRLAKTMGDSAALEIYKELLVHTKNITCEIPVDKIVYYAEPVVSDPFPVWDKSKFSFEIQNGSDLGERMKNAFKSEFKKGYEQVCIIGSDCISLQKKDINEAFSILNTHDFVIGPSTDGGYYLLGMKKFFPKLFDDKLWSTDAVLSSTIQNIKSSGKSFLLMRELTDIDNQENWIKHKISDIN